MESFWIITAAVLWGASTGLLIPRSAHRLSVPPDEPWRSVCPAGHPFVGVGNGWLGRARPRSGQFTGDRYRATEALETFRQRVDERTSGPDVPATLRELQGELREARRARHEEITDLRRPVDTLAQRVQALTLENEQLRSELARCGTVTSALSRAGRDR